MFWKKTTDPGVANTDDAAAIDAGDAEDLGIYKLIFENAGVGIFESTPSGRFVRANPRMAEILGYETADRMIDQVQDIAHAHYFDPLERTAFLERLGRSGRIERHLIRNRRVDGTAIWLRISAVAMKGPDGNVACVVGTSEDVTDLIQTQEELQRQQEDYQRLYNNSAEGIYRSSPEGKMLAANPAQARLNGYDDPEELIDSVNDIANEWYVDPDGRAKFKQKIEEHGRVKDMEAEIFRHKSGERAWIRENSWVVRDPDGKVLYYEGTVNDITDQKKAQAALALSEERQRDYAETSSDWFWETDEDHRFSHVSSNARRFGVDIDRAIGKRRQEYASVVSLSPEEAEALERNFDQLKRREPFRDFVYRAPMSAGAIEWVSISGRPHFDDAGKFLGYRGSCRIVTEEIRAANLLRKARKEAEDASVAKSRFLANMSHELRTPLNAIIGFSEMMKMETFGPIGHPRYNEYLGDIHVSANMLLSLIEDVLDISKAEAGRLDLDETEFDLVSEVDTIGQMMAPVADRGKIILHVDLPAPQMGLLADIKRFRQIAINLATNAVKFSPTGATVRLGVQREEDGGLTFLVSDDGAGMREDEVARAVRPFEQLTDSRELANEGAGLGLPLCKELAERHDAVLDIQSAPGEGTTAYVRFPAFRSCDLEGEDDGEAQSVRLTAVG